MKIKLGLLLLLMVSFLGLSGCMEKVPAGHVGVKVYLLGKSKGVDSEELGVGRYWIGINEELYLFPTFQQNYVWTKSAHEGADKDESITFQTKEGMDCNADLGITYHINPSKVTTIFQKYRKGVAEITDIYIRNQVRDALVEEASSLAVEEVYGVGKTELIKKVQGRVQSQLKDTGIEVDKLYWVGSVRLPETVLAALNSKVGATQKAQQRENELREAEAQAKKTIAEAEGRARANAILSSSITSQVIEYKKMENEARRIEKWDGKLPKVQGGNTPFINLAK